MFALAPLRIKSLGWWHEESQTYSRRSELEIVPVEHCTQINNSFVQYFIHMPTVQVVCNTETLQDIPLLCVLQLYTIFFLVPVNISWFGVCIWLNRYSKGWLVIALVVFFLVLIHPHRGSGLDKVVIDRLHILLWLILNTPTLYIYILTWMGCDLPFFDLIVKWGLPKTNTFTIGAYDLSRRTIIASR